MDETFLELFIALQILHNESPRSTTTHPCFCTSVTVVASVPCELFIRLGLVAAAGIAYPCQMVESKCAGVGKERHATAVLQATAGVCCDCHCLRKPPQE